MPSTSRIGLLTLAAGLPCVLACLAQVVPARTVPLPAPRPPAGLVFDQYGVSLPIVRPQAVVEAHFDFRNYGSEPVTVEDVEPSCGCLRWHFVGNKRTYMPGESGSLVVRLFTANERPGPHEYLLNVRSQPGPISETSLVFRVNLPERKLTVEPAEVYFYQLQGTADAQKVYVTDHREDVTTPLQVKLAQCPSKHVTVQVLPAELNESGQSRIPVLLTVPAEVPSGREVTFLKIETTDPDFPQIAVPVLIEGRPQLYGPPVPETPSADIWGILEHRRSGLEGPRPQ